MYSYIQSRFYRSPEVLLGCSYSTAIGMWSLGCILVEMHTGEPISGRRGGPDVKIYELLGLATHMIQQGTKGLKHFRRQGGSRHTLREPPRSVKQRSLTDILGVETEDQTEEAQRSGVPRDRLPAQGPDQEDALVRSGRQHALPGDLALVRAERVCGVQTEAPTAASAANAAASSGMAVGAAASSSHAGGAAAQPPG